MNYEPGASTCIRLQVGEPAQHVRKPDDRRPPSIIVEGNRQESSFPRKFNSDLALGLLDPTYAWQKRGLSGFREQFINTESSLDSRPAGWVKKSSRIEAGIREFEDLSDVVAYWCIHLKRIQQWTDLRAGFQHSIQAC